MRRTLTTRRWSTSKSFLGEKFSNVVYLVYSPFLLSYTTEVVEMYRAGKIKASPIATFDVAQMGQAYRYFNNKDRIGKVVISMENLKSKVSSGSPPTYQSVFSPEKTYLLVGCLGGLGRSLSRWMMSRGARRFCFLGAFLALDKPSAAELVNRLRDAGAQVTVVRGDVSNEDQVREAVAAAVKEGPSLVVSVQGSYGVSAKALFHLHDQQGLAPLVSSPSGGDHGISTTPSTVTMKVLNSSS